MFLIGTLVVYPAQGVGEIEKIDHRDIGGAPCDFYIVRIRSNRATLMVPVKNARAVGLRPLIDASEASAILNRLQSDLTQAIFIGQNWNRRFREYTERLKSPSLEIVANVLRELLLIGRNKELSFGERRLLEQAMSLVSEELSEVLGQDVESLRNDLLTLYAPLPREEADLQDA